MAQDNNAILKQILGVCVQINRKMDSPKKGSDAGTGPLSGKFATGKKARDLKEGTKLIDDLYKSLSNFAKLKVNPRRINTTSKAIRGLFDTVIYIGKSRKVVTNAMKLFDMLAKSLSTMTKFAKAMSTLLLSVGLSIVGLAVSIAIAGVLMGTRGKPALTMLAIVGVLVGLTGAMVLMGLAERQIDRGSKVSKGMGVGLMFLAGGLFLFVSTIAHIGKILGAQGGAKGLVIGLLGAIGIIAVMGLVFAGLGQFFVPIILGSIAAAAMGIGMASLALGLTAIAKTAGMMTAMGKGGTATNRKGEQRGEFGQMMASIGPGLGAMGIMLVSAGLLFAGLGVLSLLIIPGTVTAIAMSVALLALAGATAAIMGIAKTIDTPQIENTIQEMVGGVLTGLIKGVGGALAGGEKGIKGFANGIKNTAILTTGIGLLMGVSVALSMFALAMTAFANIDNMRVIESYDEKTGKPKFGQTVDIKGVGQTITDTLTTFLTGLLASTKDLSTQHAGAIKQMGKSLTGRRGILTAVIQFADVLKVFAQFGPEGKIGYAVPKLDEAGNPVLDAAGNPIMIQDSVKITDVTKNITDSFSQFTKGISEGVEGISRRDKNKILNMSKALIGKRFGEKSRRADKPGLLEPINAFSETLMIYSKFGADGSIPELDADGKPTGKSIPITSIVGNIVTAISSFSTELSRQLQTPGETVKQAQKKMEGYMGLIGQIGTLGDAADGLDKTATSIMSLATSMSSLADSVNKFELDKLKVFGEIVKENKTFGGLLSNIQQGGEARRESRAEAKEAKSEAKVAKTAAASESKTIVEKQDLSGLADAIGLSVAAAFKNGQFTFDFQGENKGVLVFE